jgi:hypothetical protein
MFLSGVPGVLSQTVPAPKETVTVVGVRPDEQAALAKVIDRFVEQHSAPDPKSGLLVRAAPTGICPLVLGLPQAYDDFVAKRIAEIAKSAGSAVQGPGKCDANVEVFFTNDPQGVVDLLSKQTSGAILGFHFTHQNSHIVHVYRPIQAWYVTGTHGDAHTWNSTVDSNGDEASDHMKVRIDSAYGQSPNTGTGSRLRPRMGSQIVNTLIVADLGRVGGGEIGPVADYVALLALSQPDSLDGCNDLPSILDLLSSGCKGRAAPAALTESDMAYLKSLYAADITTSGAYGQENVAKGMTKNLTGDKSCTDNSSCPKSP